MTALGAPVLNFEESNFRSIAQANFDALGNPPTADLADFFYPAPVDQPRSMARNDPPHGDFKSVNVTRVQQVEDDSPTCFVGPSSLHKTRARIDAAYPVPITAEELQNAYGMAALMLATLPRNLLWEDVTASNFAAPKVWVDAFLKEDRIPFAEGWFIPKTPFTRDDLMELGTLIAEGGDDGVSAEGDESGECDSFFHGHGPPGHGRF
jgi:hypothetical protein